MTARAETACARALGVRRPFLIPGHRPERRALALLLVSAALLAASALGPPPATPRPDGAGTQPAPVDLPGG